MLQKWQDVFISFFRTAKKSTSNDHNKLYMKKWKPEHCSKLQYLNEALFEKLNHFVFGTKPALVKFGGLKKLLAEILLN